MTNHDAAGAASQRCCDAFLRAFVQRGVERDPGENWCRFVGPDGAVAYVFHKKRLQNVTAYLRHRIGEGDALGAALESEGVTYKRRPSSGLDTGWSATTSAYVDVASPNVAGAVCRASALYWHLPMRWIGPVIPEEVPDTLGVVEGAVVRILVNRYERSPEARTACIDHYGAQCTVCRMDFAAVYGEIGAGYIHVHHLVKLADIGEEYVVDPIRDLRPVCPNCHAMLHREDPPIEPKRLAELLMANRVAATVA